MFLLIIIIEQERISYFACWVWFFSFINLWRWVFYWVNWYI